MAAQNKLKAELYTHRMEHGLVKMAPCSPQDNERYINLLKSGQRLPEGVYVYDGNACNYTTSVTFETLPPQPEFFTIQDNALNEHELAEYLTYKKLAYLKTIRNCVVFFTVLIVIGLVIELISGMAAVGMVSCAF